MIFTNKEEFINIAEQAKNFKTPEGRAYYIENVALLNKIVSKLFQSVDQAKKSGIVERVQAHILIYDFALKNFKEVELNTIALDNYLLCADNVSKITTNTPLN
jgi:hypothetical protein